ncbi:hypothetical protein [Arthrobacter castelli]|uniref:hypothetical protein n=1 Tax=Arthrobacter castelli TaxID=271431 RepID=UPI0003F6B33D|nr:hypothetical protein [Arthrobacter castelli]
MLYEINGLPAHILLLHVTVILVPVAALCTVLSLVWPTARRRLGVVTPLLAVLAAAVVPATQLAGEWLALRVVHTPVLEEHIARGRNLEWWVAAVALLAVGQWLWFRYRPQPREATDMYRPDSRVTRSTGTGSGGTRLATKRRGAVGGSTGRALMLVTVLVTVAVAAGTVTQVVLIGEAGSRAVWTGNYSQDPVDLP